MKYSDLKSFFELRTDAETLKSIIQEEVADHFYNLKTKKKSSVIIDEVDNEYFILDIPEFEMVCKAYLDGGIDPYELSYIADAIQFSENFDFKNLETANLFSMITDPEINGPINQKVISKLLESVK